MNPSVRYSKSLFIFRRDLRCVDNTALNAALKNSSSVAACFIFDPRQIQSHPFQSKPALTFMLQALKELQEALKNKGGRLYVFEGRAHDVVETLIAKERIQSVYVNEDYTPFSVSRDLAIKKVCAKHRVDFHALIDALLHAPSDVIKTGGGVYTVFTPYWKKAVILPVAKPAKLAAGIFWTRPVSVPEGSFPSIPSIQSTAASKFKGARVAALAILNDLRQFKNYDTQRNFPAQSATTGLSMHHKFGTCSVRESYWAMVHQLGLTHTLVRELYWRDFFTQIAYHFPHVFQGAFYDQYNALEWSQDQKLFRAWCDGQTGFPIVDAGMRELNATGFMHNRVRMITASFLVKDLHIHWQWGERYFAQKLIDYDPCVNNGNWQWAASTGCDHQPYFRIFNPWLQQKKFDPQAQYIQQWVPELRALPAEDIHQWFKRSGNLLTDYPLPIVDHATQAERAKKMFQNVKREKSD